jgi:hypothetical protein
MKQADIDIAVTQARLFIRRAEHLAALEVAERLKGTDSIYFSSNPKETAALRRTSMELTRALAQMRARK